MKENLCEYFSTFWVSKIHLARDLLGCRECRRTENFAGNPSSAFVTLLIAKPHVMLSPLGKAVFLCSLNCLITKYLSCPQVARAW